MLIKRLKGHQNSLKLCEKKQIQLRQIFEAKHAKAHKTAFLLRNLII